MVERLHRIGKEEEVLGRPETRRGQDWSIKEEDTQFDQTDADHPGSPVHVPAVAGALV